MRFCIIIMIIKSLNRLNNTYLSDGPILNSFHGLNIYADFFKINLDQEKYFFINMFK